MGKHVQAFSLPTKKKGLLGVIGRNGAGKQQPLIFVKSYS